MQSACVRRPFTGGAAAPARAAVLRRASVVVAVKPTKAADFRGLSDEEVVSKIVSLKSELASVRFLQRTRGVAEVKPGDLPQPDPEKVPKANLNKHIRRQVAQLWTVLRERQIKAGVSARERRKQESLSRVGI